MRRLVVIPVVLALAVLACYAPVTTVVAPTQAPLVTPLPPQPTLPQPTVQPTPVLDQTGGARPAELTSEMIDRVTRAAVQIVAARGAGAQAQPMWTGSGTIISPEGEIITNCHVACGAPVLIINMTTNPDQPPTPSYIAEITHYSEDLDLALLRIRTDINGNPVSPTDLPYLGIGDSNELRLGDRIYIFGYPGVGGETITFTTGSVSGFESADVNGVSQRVVIKTDANIASGNSGGTAVDLYGRLVAIPTAVNPDVREGVTLGGLGILRPVNLMGAVRQQTGQPPVEEAGLPPQTDPDGYEPNDTLDQATGPLAAGDSVSAYISWAQDIDVYWLRTSSTAPIEVRLTNIPSGTDYDLYLLDQSGNVLSASESETSQESISYSPPSAGAYFVAVVAYSGWSTSAPYTLAVSYDGGAAGGAGGGAAAGGIVISGRAVDGATGRGLAGGVFGILRPDVTCAQFFNSAQLDLNMVVSSGETNSQGYFRLTGVPRGATYPAFFVFGSNRVCENGWLEVPTDAVDTDLGDIEMSFN